MRRFLKKNGVCGLIIPSGIYSDLGSQGLRKLLLSENNITDLFSLICHDKVQQQDLIL